MLQGSCQGPGVQEVEVKSMSKGIRFNLEQQIRPYLETIPKGECETVKDSAILTREIQHYRLSKSKELVGV